jgi:hypothetical protein
VNGSNERRVVREKSVSWLFRVLLEGRGDRSIVETVKAGGESFWKMLFQGIAWEVERIALVAIAVDPK